MQILILGYGNTLRSDDGAGQIVADTVATWDLPQVRSLSVHQLTPELAEPLSQAQRAIFVDAYPAAAVQVQVLQPPATRTENLEGALPSPGLTVGHAADPRSLLALTQQVYGVAPASWLFLIPAVNFEFGEQLSSVTQQGITWALAEIQHLIQKLES